MLAGCSDHAVSLIPKHWMELLGSITSHFKLPNPIPQLKAIMNHVTGLGKKEFEGFFVSKFGSAKKPKLVSTNDTRYCSWALAAKCVSDNIDTFTLFLQTKNVSEVTPEDLVGPFQIEVIHLLSNAADIFLLPFMKKADEVKTAGEYKALFESWISKLKSSLSSGEEYWSFWGLDISDQEEFITIFDKYSTHISSYLTKIDEKAKSIHTRMKKTKNEEWIYKKCDSLSNPNEYYFLLSVEFTLDSIYMLKQKFG